MWESLIPWLKTCSFVIAFLHILFHLPHFIENLSTEMVYAAGYIHVDNPLSLLRLIELLDNMLAL